MPVGAIIGGVSGLAGAIIGGNKNSKAINKASDAQSAAIKEATALQRDIYNQNVGFQTPLYNTGIAAMGQINALLGLPGQSGAAPATGTPATGGVQTGGTGSLPTQPVFGGGSQGQPGGALSIQPSSTMQMAATNPFIRAIVGSAYQNGAPLSEAAIEAYGLTPQATTTAAPTTGTTPANTTPAPTTAEAANAAYERFKNYTGYQTRLDEGLEAINSGYAANGTLQSGAAMQAINKFGQDYASNEFNNYMGYLGGQQQLASGAANALSGVGTNYANAAGNLAIQNGQNIANTAVAKANNFNNTMGNIAQVFSNAMGGFGGF